MFIYLAIFFLCSLQSLDASRDKYVAITTKNGDLRGRKLHVLNKWVTEFLAVPYGKAPLRFAQSEAIDPWEGVKNATSLGPDCYSTRDTAFPKFEGAEMWNGKTDFSEDCLHVNIWAPKDVHNATVLVWIFGGGFVSGSPSLDLYNGSIMAAQANVVVVNVNYRLGPFGFLHFGKNSSAPGNVGLSDQQFALKWVQANIKYFGGDPNKVTIFGESAGAASVSAHLLAPDSWPLFRHAIMQSAGITCPWAIETLDEARQTTDRFLALLSCNAGSVEKQLECARQKPANAINEAARNMLAEATFLDFTFVPVVEDSHFFKGHALRNLYKGHVKKAPVLMGYNIDEGTYFLPYYLSEYFNNTSHGHINRLQYWNSVDKAFSGDMSSLLRKAVAFQYSMTEHEHLTHHATFYRDALAKSVGDYYFTCPTLGMAQLLRAHGLHVYVYEFAQPSSVNPWPSWMGVMHGYEIEFILGVPLRPDSAHTEAERYFSKSVLNQWTHFAKHGAMSSGTSWPQYGHDKYYTKLSAAVSNLQKRPNAKECAFWKDVTDADACNSVAQNATFAAAGGQCVHLMSNQPIPILTLILVWVLVQVHISNL